MAEPKHADRILRERGIQSDPRPPLTVVKAGDGIAPLEPEPEDDPDTPDYKPYLCTRSKQPARLWLKPEWRSKAYSVQWYPVPVIVSDLDRESDVPQVIEIVGAGGRYRIEGHRLEGLMVRLNDQHVREVRAYCPKRWPGKRPPKGDPIVMHIRYEREEVVAGRGADRVAPMPVPEEVLSGEEMEF